MEIGNFISNAIKNYNNGEYNTALMLACSAIDATAKKTCSNLNNNERIKNFISENMRIVSFFGMPGISCGGMKVGCNSIPEIKKDRDNLVGLEDIIYYAIRCNLIHECRPDPRIQFTSQTRIGEMNGKFFLPSQILWGLIFAVILSEANKDEKVDLNTEIKLNNVKYSLNDLWGRKDELLPVLHHSVR